MKGDSSTTSSGSEEREDMTKSKSRKTEKMKPDVDVVDDKLERLRRALTDELDRHFGIRRERSVAAYTEFRQELDDAYEKLLSKSDGEDGYDKGLASSAARLAAHLVRDERMSLSLAITRASHCYGGVSERAVEFELAAGFEK